MVYGSLLSFLPLLQSLSLFLCVCLTRGQTEMRWDPLAFYVLGIPDARCPWHLGRRAVREHGEQPVVIASTGPRGRNRGVQAGGVTLLFSVPLTFSRGFRRAKVQGLQRIPFATEFGGRFGLDGKRFGGPVTGKASSLVRKRALPSLLAASAGSEVRAPPRPAAVRSAVKIGQPPIKFCHRLVKRGSLEGLLVQRIMPYSPLQRKIPLD
jgi:hypothetical protein